MIDVEDGSAKANAVSYCTLAFADVWHAGRGMTLWATLSEEEKEQALVRATDYMVQCYRTRWAGRRATTTQALDWPRYDVPMVDSPSAYGGAAYYASNIVPLEVQRACAEAAFKAAFGDMAPDATQAKKSVSVGPISITYADGSIAVKRLYAIDRMLAPLMVGSGGQLQVVRC